MFDPTLLDGVVDAAGPLEGRDVLEIGPGPGGLSAAILRSPAASLLAIERDARFVSALAPLARGAAGRFEVLEADALNAPWRARPSIPSVVIANLPYNLSTPLTILLLQDLDRFERMALMYQREVAERIAAAPGSKAYGRLSILAQRLCSVRAARQLPPGAFRPPPKVASTVLRFDRRARPLAEAEPRALEAVVKAAFAQRRKMLRRSLAALGLDPLVLLDAARIEPTRRAETLEIEECCALARAYVELRRSSA